MSLHAFVFSDFEEYFLATQFPFRALLLHFNVHDVPFLSLFLFLEIKLEVKSEF